MPQAETQAPVLLPTIIPAAEYRWVMPLYSVESLAGKRQCCRLHKKDFAEALKTSQQQVGRLESPCHEGHSFSMLRRVADVLHTRVRIVFERVKKRNRIACRRGSCTVSRQTQFSQAHIGKHDSHLFCLLILANNSAIANEHSQSSYPCQLKPAAPAFEQHLEEHFVRGFF